MFGWAANRSQVVGRIDKADVREGLREVPDEPASRRVVLLGEEPEVVAEIEDPFEDPSRLSAAAEKSQAVGEPEGAGEESRLSRRESVDLGARRVAAHEAVVEELALNRFDRPGHAGIRGRKEADERNPQQTRVQLAGPVVLVKVIRSAS